MKNKLFLVLDLMFTTSECLERNFLSVSKEFVRDLYNQSIAV